MAINEIWGWVGAIVGLVGYIPYCAQILTNPSVRPDRPSWAIWTIEYGVLACTLVALDTPAHLLAIPGLQLLGVVVTFVLSIKRGVGQFGVRQYALLGCVGVAMIARFLISPSAAIVLLIAVEASGVACTCIKVYKSPRSEPLIFWWCVAFAGIAGLPAVTPNAEPIMYAYPASLAAMGGVVVGIALLRRQAESLTVIPTQ